MNELCKIKDYAENNSVPVMRDDGIEFICRYIRNHDVRRILEIGTAIGYSAIRFAGVSENVFVTSIEYDIDRHIRAVQNVHDCGLSDRIELVNADALSYSTGGSYDLIFIDAAKSQYIKFFEKYKHNLSESGVIISDNISFHGKVADLSLVYTYGTLKLVRKIRKYIDFLRQNEEFETEYFPCGDGITVSKRRAGF